MRTAGEGMETHRAYAERSTVFDFEISGRTPFELGRISDKRLAQFRP